MLLTIKKGSHYSDKFSICEIPIPNFVKNKSYTFTFKIEADIWIEFNHWNKLWGYGKQCSRCNSIRIGWMYKDGMMNYTIFREVNKEWVAHGLLKALVGQEIKMEYNKSYFKLSCLKSDYKESNEEIVYHFTSDKDQELKNAFLLLELHPYFGGNPVANTDYRITKN